MRIPRWSLKVGLLVASFTTSACDLVDPWLAPGATKFTPPPVYERWWSMVESCSGLSRPIHTVPFYVVRGANEVPLENGDQVGGYWSPAGDLIVLAELYQLHGPVVRHEMLHAMLQRTGHPRETFIGRCAGIMACGPTCLSDAGPATVSTASAARVQSSHLVLGIDVSPEVPRSSEDGGFFSITVTAQNPSPHAVLVEGVAGTFALQFSGPGGGFFQGGPAYLETFLFAPGETKRQVFDFKAGTPDASGITYPVGEYAMRARYGNAWTSFRPLVLLP